VQTIDVILHKDGFPAELEPGKVAVALDIIFATTSMVTALHHGVASIVPAMDLDDARAIAAGRDPGAYLLCGEYHGENFEGGWPYHPLAMTDPRLAGKHLIHATTNGTVALRRAEPYGPVYVGALVNARALVKHLLARHARASFVLVCAGTRGNFGLEDGYAAGCLTDLILRQSAPGQFELSDTAQAMLRVYRGGEAEPTVVDSFVGRRMTGRGLLADVQYSARRDLYDVVPLYTNGRIVDVANT
jgi:2-phosphosulfolactate phosphatase